MKVTQTVSFLINYKPILNRRKNIKNKKLIYCKNFFLFFLLINNINANSSNNYSVLIKKKNNYRKTFLRAPNKYKKAQVAIEILRYEITIRKTFNYVLNKNNLYKKNVLLSILYFINFFFNFFLFIESPLFFLKKKKLNIEFNTYLYKKSIFEL